MEMNKKLACGLWATSVLGIITSIFSLIPSFENLASYADSNVAGYAIGIIVYSIVCIVVGLISRILLGYNVWQDKNNKGTFVIVILNALFASSFGGIVAFIMRLILRKNDSPSIRKAWFVPAIITFVIAVIVSVVSTGFTVLGVISLLINTTFDLIFGYWFLKYLKLN